MHKVIKSKVLNSQYPAIQLDVTRAYIEFVLKDLLAKIKGFKYEIILKTLFLRKNKMMKQSIDHQSV